MKTHTILLKFLMVFAFFIPGIMLQAQDRLFTYAYQSTVLNKSQRELESWHTFRAGRDQFYLRYDNRTEFEVGLGSNLQTAFYLNLTSKTTTVLRDSVRQLSTGTEIGFSNEWKYKLLDPVADPLGLALYAEAGISTDEFELEGKLILDKQLGRFLVAFNGVYECELIPGYTGDKLEWEAEHKLDGYLSVAFRVKPGFHLTLENRFRNMFGDGSVNHSAWYLGPGFSYSSGPFWVNFTAMPQVVAFTGATSGNLDLDEYEKAQFRLLFSYVF